MISSHKYQQQIALHEKASKILKAKIRRFERLDRAQERLKEWDAATHWQPIRLMYRRRDLEHEVEIQTKAIPWLNKYYARIAKEVRQCIPVVEIYDGEVQGITSIKMTSENMNLINPKSFMNLIDGKSLVEPSGAYGYDNFWYNSHQK